MGVRVMMTTNCKASALDAIKGQISTNCKLMCFESKTHHHVTSVVPFWNKIRRGSIIIDNAKKLQWSGVVNNKNKVKTITGFFGKQSLPTDRAVLSGPDISESKQNVNTR